jgi:hypothetical protein
VHTAVPTHQTSCVLTGVYGVAILTCSTKLHNNDAVVLLVSGKRTMSVYNALCDLQLAIVVPPMPKDISKLEKKGKLIPIVNSDIFISIKAPHMDNIISKAKNHEFRKYLIPGTVTRMWCVCLPPRGYDDMEAA